MSTPKPPPPESLQLPAWQLALRFVLELSALIAVGAWARGLTEGVVGILAMIGAPLVLAALWGTFAVKGDPSRSGAAPVPVPGWVRLILELFVFGSGAASLLVVGRYELASLFVAALLVHQLGTTKRLAWLLKQR